VRGKGRVGLRGSGDARERGVYRFVCRLVR
jgi:hypothetical protein